MTRYQLSRRRMLSGAGSLMVSFSITGARAQEGEVAGGARPAVPVAEKLPGSLPAAPYLDAWIKLDAQGRVTIFSGKAELGQGIKTALVCVAAEEIGVKLDTVTLITPDTDRTPNEGYTAGSQSMQNSATALRHAAAHLRKILISQAALKFQVDVSGLTAGSGHVRASDGRTIPYAELAAGLDLHVSVEPSPVLKPSRDYQLAGRTLARIDIPAKVTGGEAYVHDLRLPAMLHARVVRPPGPGAKLIELDATSVEKLNGVVRVIRDGDFLAVVAGREWQCVKAMRMLAAAARWSAPSPRPNPVDIYATLESLVSEQGIVADVGVEPPAGGKTLEATFTRPYQMHGSIGPSAAVAQLDGDKLTIWSHTQGVFPDRAAISEMLAMPPEKVRVIHLEGSGCYGHNGADDAAADAALIARAMPGSAIRVQWTREQEHGNEPYGPAMIGRVRATMGDDGRILAWNYGVWSNIHTTRPGPAGALLAARHVSKSFAEPGVKIEITPAGNGDRNAVPLYNFARKKVIWHFIKQMPLRVSALRALGAYLNVFAIESFMDELALAATADPVEFRLRHLEDPRARDVVTLAAEKFGWKANAARQAGRGRGFAFARYKNLAAYCAVAVDVEVDRETGRIHVTRAIAAVDSGEIIDADGIRNQIEGGILQSLSWTLYEQVSFDEKQIHSLDWASYPILRFKAAPRSVDVHIIPRPGAPFLGTGEAAQGPAAAAIANAVADAIGHRIRQLPLSADRIKTAVGNA